METQKQNLLSLSLEELEDFTLKFNMKKFAAKQIFNWLHQKNIRKIEEMTNISAAFRESLTEHSHIPYLEMLNHQVSKKDGTEKFLFELADGSTIETVLIKHKERNTVCISTQVGCPVKCAFCATGMAGFARNLDVSEIINQVYFINKRLMKKGENVTHLVYMGMGEPLINVDQVIKSIKILGSVEGLNISMRRITVSTSGVIPGILKLMEEKLPVGLAISLHAPNNTKRDLLVPINRSYPIDDLIGILVEYQKATKRRITFEYVMLKDINTSYTDAEQLSFIVRKVDHNLNLIPYNKVNGTDFERPPEGKVQKFYEFLKNNLRVNVTLRLEKGSDIDGACGQLKQRHGEKQNEK